MSYQPTPDTYPPCPYCQHENIVRHYDDWEGCQLEGTTEKECRGCGKTFIVSRAVYFTYDTVGKADCLNEAKPAKFHTWHDHGNGLQSCTVCGKQRGKYSPKFLKSVGIEPKGDVK